MKISKKPYNFVCVIILLTSFSCVNKSMEQSHRTHSSTKGDRSYASTPAKGNASPINLLYHAYENGPELSLYSILLKKDIMRVFWAPCKLNQNDHSDAELYTVHNNLKQGFKLTKIHIGEGYTEVRMQKNGESDTATYPPTSCIYQFIKTKNIK